MIQVKTLAEDLAASAWHTVTWREGVAGEITSRFAAVRVRPAQGDSKRSIPRPEEWLLIEWPAGENAPTKFWLANLPESTTIRTVVLEAKHRWIIERDYQELKQELGLGYYEGRGWRGFHHHAALWIAAYGFLVGERAAFPPSGPCRPPRPDSIGQKTAIPASRKGPTTASPHRAACPKLNRFAPAQIGEGSCRETPKMPMPPPNDR